MSKFPRDNTITLTANERPTAWYNVVADMPTKPEPSLNAANLQELTGPDLEAIFPKVLIAQEVSLERYIEIPDEVQAFYDLYRATPLVRCYRLEKYLDTPAKIYYKYEGANPGGSHKLNTAVAQVYYNKQEGVKRLTTETGAGQWGCAVSMAANYFGLEMQVYMVKVSYNQKPYRRHFMELYNGKVCASPSPYTQAGRNVLAADPNCKGSLGIAISEAVEDALQREDTKYSLGSVLNHVSLHQTIIGQEAKTQIQKADDYPDIVIGCAGGGSNLSGIAFPFVQDKVNGKKVDILAVEPTACPTLTKGKFAYDYGDTAKMAPVCKMYTLGHDFIPSGIHAGGLRYHGMSPLISQLRNDGLIDAVAYNQNEVFDAAKLFAQTEFILPAPESSHAIKAAIDEALKAKEAGEAKTILFCLSGHGFFDMQAYASYMAGDLQDIEFDPKNFGHLPEIK
ncbi:MAG: TrpB-like pyridoxal phosphate-dependent enzyme [Clostridia bacterium]|nr:TrpB-like pyridoxal phosphate-dependent enzyme [Clostridia bacterium]